MTTSTLTLAQFLLDRIAEDEAPTWELVPYRCEPGCCAPAGWVGHRCLICGREEFGGTVEAITGIAREHDETIHRRARVLAECEAKRRIVGAHPIYRGPRILEVDSSGTDYGCELCHCIDPIRVDGIIEANGYCETLLLLAMPYADHPDYDPGWRP